MLIPTIHPLRQLKEDLRKLGIQPGDTILMHSSYNSMGPMEGGAAGFFAAFQEVLGEEGTLILPALTYSYVNREQQVFNRQTTPSCIGYLPEFFRTQVDGVVRSLHPTHSCCVWGKRAEAMIADHQLDHTPVGKNSPFAKLPKVGGKILLLGSNLHANTSMHGVEETAEPPYLLNRVSPVAYTLIDGDREISQTVYRHAFAGPDGVRCYRQCYGRVIPLLEGEEVRHGKVLDADCWLLDAAAVWQKGHDKLLEDPYYFVEYYDPAESPR